MLKAKTRRAREKQDALEAREPNRAQVQDKRTKNPIPSAIRSHLQTLLTRKYSPPPKKGTRIIKRRARALSNAVAAWQWKMNWKSIAKKVAQKIMERDRVKLCSLRLRLQQGLVADLEVRRPFFMVLMLLFGLICLWALLAVGRCLRG